jgi:hypothetical protein
MGAAGQQVAPATLNTSFYDIYKDRPKLDREAGSGKALRSGKEGGEEKRRSRPEKEDREAFKARSLAQGN